jgi:hypothetical protein
MENLVYELKDARSPLKKALPYALAAAGLVVAGFIVASLAWVLWGLGLVAAGVAVANYLSVSPQAVLLTNDKIVLRTKAGDRALMLGEITKAELTYREPGGAVKRIGFFGADSFTADESAVLTLTDASNRRLEVSAKEFALADFRSFLDVFQVNGNSGRLIDEQKFDGLIAQNNEYVRQDRQLRGDLQQTLLESYKSIYNPRGEFYFKQNPGLEVVYRHQPNPNEGGTYFLKDDYVEGLDGGSVQAGLNLLANTQKNLETVETRLAYYQKIDEKLQTMKEAQKARARVSKVAGRLETQQRQNELAAGKQDELGLQTDTLEQLKLLSADLRNQDDLGTSQLLKQVDELLAK